MTLGFLYYCNAALFRDQLASWSAWPTQLRRQSFFLVVDDGSPTGAEAAVQLSPTLLHRLRISICRVQQNLAWNIGGARNLIFAFAPTEYVLMLDMDVVVPVAFAAKLPLLIDAIRNIEQRDRKYKVLTYFPRKGARPHPAVMLLRRATYWSAGGCDEDFVGSYGVTDVHFRWRASRTGNITLHSQYDQPLAKDLPELAQTRIRLDSACPPLVRNATRNKLLLLAKQSGRVRWSSEYLRFTWDFAPCTLSYRGSGPAPGC